MKRLREDVYALRLVFDERLRLGPGLEGEVLRERVQVVALRLAPR